MFQYTKRLQCVENIPSGQRSHQGTHIHTNKKDRSHFCESRCKFCDYYCTSLLGHKRREHQTSHGSMTQTRWAIDGPDGTTLELGGRKFSSNDEGATMMYNLVCSSLGIHVHFDYCRSGGGRTCGDAEDSVTHGLSWRRMGFKDPISDSSVQDVCCSAVQLGKLLSFHSVSFGQDSWSSSLRRMAQLALEIQNNAPP
ncbi:hypothetical protein EDB87DRAFT_1221331 [Lactarius vividus]|nr:hypothetical protein EDB87DRAFT_1221331 [Lactarius vividus]